MSAEDAGVFGYGKIEDLLKPPNQTKIVGMQRTDEE
jgi:hypothetical protein